MLITDISQIPADKKHYWEWISRYLNLSEPFIRKYKNKVDWFRIFKYQYLSEDFIGEFLYKIEHQISWSWIAKYQYLTEQFIEKNQNKIDWYWVSKQQKLEEAFIEKFQDKVSWHWILRYQSLSEEFIEKFIEKFNFVDIFKYQKVSEDFIDKFKDRLDMDFVLKYQKLSNEYIDKNNIKISNHNWLYKTENWKLEYIKINNIGEMYEILNDEFLIAYKTCRHDGYSVSNFGYKYEPQKNYISRCNFNPEDENSFGISAWTKEKALDYCPTGILLKVQIKIGDIGCFVHGSAKVRCQELKVLGMIG